MPGGCQPISRWARWISDSASFSCQLSDRATHFKHRLASSARCQRVEQLETVSANQSLLEKSECIKFNGIIYRVFSISEYQATAWSQKASVQRVGWDGQHAHNEGP